MQTGGRAMRRQWTRSSMRALLAIAALATFARAAVAQDYAAIVAAADRSDADRQTHQRRAPEKMLAFTGVKSGMTVLDVEANPGDSTERLPRAVSAPGKAYAQDS